MNPKMPKEESQPSFNGPDKESSKKHGPEELVNAIVSKLHLLKLAPSPVPCKVAASFTPDSSISYSNCSFCEAGGAFMLVPEVEFDLKTRTARLLRHKAICENCHDVHDLKKLNNGMANAMLKKKKDHFQKVYQHFLKINDIANNQQLQLQDVICIANTLNMIYSEILWNCITA